MSTSPEKQVSLLPFNTFRIDAKANLFADIKSESDLISLFEQGLIPFQPMLILGGGSNILFTGDFKGLVLKVSIPGITVQELPDQVRVTAGAGVVWNDLVTFAVGKNLGGLENLSLIPGTVGAAPVQNIGAYGVELKDTFYSCRAFDLGKGEFHTFFNADCNFSYRESIFKQELKGKYLITQVTFVLHKNATVNTQYGAISQELMARGIVRPTIKNVSDVVSSIRVSKLPDPSTIGNAGSFFKNPVVKKELFDRLVARFPDIVNYPAGSGKVKLAAGWLIEQCGFKGRVAGHTGTWKNQALVIVNHGGATGEEVYNFSEEIIESVNKKFGIRLTREVNIF